MNEELLENSNIDQDQSFDIDFPMSEEQRATDLITPLVTNRKSHALLLTSSRYSTTGVLKSNDKQNSSFEVVPKAYRNNVQASV